MKKLSLLTLLLLSATSFAKEVHPKPIVAKEVPTAASSSKEVHHRPIVAKETPEKATAPTAAPVSLTQEQINSNLDNMMNYLVQSNLIKPEFVAVGNTFVSDVPRTRDGRLFYLTKDMNELATLPGFSMSAPSGFAGAWGVVYAGVGATHGMDSKTNDASASVGMGWGDGNKYVGGSATIGLGSIDPRDGGAFERGNFSFSLGHNFSAIETGVSVGVTGVDLWKATNNTNTDPSVYLAVSKYFNNDWKPMFLTAGVGNNVYAPITTKDFGQRTDKFGGFASGAIYLHPQLSFIVDYTSDMLSAGFGIVPMPQYPVNLSIGAADLNKQNSNREISIVGSLSVAYTF